MTYVLKTRSALGGLVPLNGEHIEYDHLCTACADAQLLSDVKGETVFVVDFATDNVLGFAVPTPARQAA